VGRTMTARRAYAALGRSTFSKPPALPEVADSQINPPALLERLPEFDSSGSHCGVCLA
jgi:hypothetical protein